MEVQPTPQGCEIPAAVEHKYPRPLTPRSQAMYAAIVRHKLENDGCAPSIRELMDAVGISSTSVAGWHLHRLERAGLIQLGGGSRSIRVVGGKWSHN